MMRSAQSISNKCQPLSITKKNLLIVDIYIYLSKHKYSIEFDTFKFQ